MKLTMKVLLSLVCAVSINLQAQTLRAFDNNGLQVYSSLQNAQQEAEKKLREQLQSALDDIVAKEKFPGATLAVVLPSGTVIDLASGMADPDAKQKMPVGAKMFCGSTGKTIVSAVALRLIADGKFKLDERVSKYFKDEADRQWYDKLPNADSMTIRSLMNHTSGLPRYLFQKDFLADIKANPMKSRSPRYGLKALCDVKPVFEVGKGWSYSDSNYLLLGLVIEKVTGKKFYDIAEQQIIKPFDLKNTVPTTQPKLDGLTMGHIGSVNFFGLPKKTVKDGKYVMNPDFEWCGGGYVTNARDLAVWMSKLHGGKVLDKKMYQQLVTPVGFRDGKQAEQGYGLGSFVWKTRNGMFFGHAGIMPGHLTQIEYSKKHKIAIAFQTNTDQGMGRTLHRHVQSIANLVINATKK